MTEQYIYFIHNKDRGLIKIGISYALERRLNNLKLMEHTDNLEVLLLLRGFPTNTEAKLHNMFADLRVRDEWFKADDRLMDFINRARQDGEIIDFGKSMRLFCEIEESIDKLFHNTECRKYKEVYTKAPKDYLSIEEMDKLFEITKIYKDWYEELLFIYHTGSTVSEMVNITKNNIDIETGTIHFTGYKVKDRDIPIDEELKPLLVEMLKRHGNKLFAYRAATFQSHFRQLSAIADLGREITPMTIRFTYGNRLLKKYSPKEVQRIMGYTNLNSISDLFD